MGRRRRETPKVIVSKEQDGDAPAVASSSNPTEPHKPREERPQKMEKKRNHKRVAVPRAEATPAASSAACNTRLRMPVPWVREYDFSDSFYTPHTVLALVIIVTAVLLLLRYEYYPSMSAAASVKLGLAAAAFTFIGFGAVHLPDSLLVRPHPAVWRAVLACGVIYLVLLTFFLFQDIHLVHIILGYYDPSLRTPLLDREYAADCRLRTPEDPFLFIHTTFDAFILAHFFGYIVKALVLRDWRMVTCVSLGFEVLEVTFQHVLPNFRECWWDHLLLDVLLCNAGGTLVGMYLLRLLRAKRYHWIALFEITTMKGKARRLLGQLGPRSFESYNWHIFESPTRFLQVAGVLVLALLQEVNCFTLKAMLNMPPKHPLVTARLALWALLATPALREYYEYITNEHVQRIGTAAWVTLLGLVVETIFIVKLGFEGHFFQEPMPGYIAIPWVVALLLFGAWLLLYFRGLSELQRRTRRGVAYHLTNILFYSAGLAIAAVFAMGLPDLQIGRRAFNNVVGPYEPYFFFWRT